MPQLDHCHDQVVRALQKVGWDVGENPYILPVEGRRRPLQIDIYAHRTMNSHPEMIIIVEVKCFGDERSELNDLYTAIGQYIVYRNLLRQRNITDDLYLAIPLHAYEGVFRQVATPIMDEIQLKMIVVNLDKEEIEQWLG